MLHYTLFLNKLCPKSPSWVYFLSFAYAYTPLVLSPYGGCHGGCGN
jgi:hypothetical protein